MGRSKAAALCVASLPGPWRDPAREMAMRHSMLVLMAGFATVGLAACDRGTQQVSATNPTVTYEFDRDDPSKAANMAAEYCGQFGKTARQGAITEHDGYRRVTFECV